MATQILVIFLIRTAAPVWASRPSGALVATSLGALAAAIVLALSPVGAVLGFAPLPWPILLVVGALVVGYLACTEGVKRAASGRRWSAKQARRGSPSCGTCRREVAS